VLVLKLLRKYLRTVIAVRMQVTEAIVIVCC